MKQVVVKTCFLSLLAVTSFAAVGGEPRNSNSDTLIEEKVSVQGLDGSTLQMTQILRPNADGTVTVVDLKPEEKVSEFFERQCASVGSQWSGLDNGETTLSEGAIYGFTCEN